ncbi:MAG: amino acid ABC transporter permease [Thermomicrobiales bacterium]|nr:amino acid ABC transporter permease [Thermomicrobiales bacterium]
MLFWERFVANLPYFLEVLIPAAGMTVRIAAGAFVLAIVVGLVLALLQTFRVGLLTLVVRTYIEIVRGTPVLAQLFILYFGLTQVGIRFTPIQAAIIGLGFNGGAYLAEVFRAGIESIHRGQMEAALTVGLTPMAAMRWVIIPQAMRVVVPPTTNYSIALLKDTAVVSAVAAPEIMFKARNLVMETYLSAQIYLLVALMYLVMSLILAWISRRLERRLAVSTATGDGSATFA